MKKLLILLFSILISFNSYGLFHETVCVETDAQYRNQLYYLPNMTKPFSGKNLCEYENGQYKSEGKVKKGNKDGKWIFWNVNGQIEKEEHYKDGKSVGETKYDYYSNGQIKEEINYKDDKKDGKWTIWHPNGQLSAVENYKNGKADGKSTSWYEDGQIAVEGNYKDSKEDGKWTKWHKNGKKKWNCWGLC